MPKNIKVLIAEDHNIVREGLKILISSDPEIKIAGEADNGEKAVKLARKLAPDVVLMDLAMPRSNGLEATREICAQAPASKVLVLSAYHDDESVRKVMDAGAAGYLSKHSAANELLTAIREVNKGNHYFSQAIAMRMKRQVRDSFVRGRLAPGPAELTSREREVLLLIARGLANKEIAWELSLSVKTVEKHRQQVMDKLGIHDVAGLTRYAVSKGLLAPPAPPPAIVASRPPGISGGLQPRAQI